MKFRRAKHDAKVEATRKSDPYIYKGKKIVPGSSAVNRNRHRIRPDEVSDSKPF